jgi:hypothetical protein
MLEYGIGITLYVKITDKKRLPLCGLVQPAFPHDHRYAMRVFHCELRGEAVSLLK